MIYCRRVLFIEWGLVSVTSVRARGIARRPKVETRAHIHDGRAALKMCFMVAVINQIARDSNGIVLVSRGVALGRYKPLWNQRANRAR